MFSDLLESFSVISRMSMMNRSIRSSLRVSRTILLLLRYQKSPLVIVNNEGTDRRHGGFPLLLRQLGPVRRNRYFNLHKPVDLSSFKEITIHCSWGQSSPLF